jgi:RNA polymerase sigma factor (TIGR02999 family)
MADVTRLLDAAAAGDPRAAADLLPLGYDELRKLAAARMADEKPGLTLQPTALVHEAYVRLVGGGVPPADWNGRGHFFAAAAEAMRRILVEAARKKSAAKRGAGLARKEFDADLLATREADEDLLALDEALRRLAEKDPAKARLVELRHFAGMTIEEAALALGISVTTANRYWTYARAWLHQQVAGEAGPDNS